MEDKKTVDAFIKFLFDAARGKNRWGYVWGGRGKVYDEKEAEWLFSHYRTAKYDKTYYYTTQMRRWKGHKVSDCSGLLEAFSGINKTAKGFFDAGLDKGKIATFPKIPGYLLFIGSKGSENMVHVGVYAGDGEVVENKDSVTGCVVTKLALRPWTHWCKPHFLDFAKDSGGEEEKFVFKREMRLVSPLIRGEDVKTLQRMLGKEGIGVGSSGVDGIFGKRTEEAVLRFQKAAGLKTDGIAGEKTVGALGGLWKELS